MKIIVLVKQVPDTSEISVDKETGTLIRTGIPSIINPDDLAGLEEALQLKDQLQATVCVVTMGPPQAEAMLRECLAMGADEAVLISDAKFAGADTWATSNTLASALKKLPYDIIIAGRQAIDGDTAQVGPQVAEKLQIPQVTCIEEIMEMKDTSLVVKKAYDDHSEIVETAIPCLLTTMASMNQPRFMNCKDIWTAFDKTIPILKFEDLDLKPEQVGLQGSPTSVKRTFTKDITTKTETYTLEPDAAAKLIADVLREKQLWH